MKSTRMRSNGFGVTLFPALATVALTLVCTTVFAADGESPSRSPVLLMGDSMMKLPGIAMKRALTRLDGVEAHTFADIGTGLARLDAFDWLGKIDGLCQEHKPKVAVVALGANDRQPMQLNPSREIVQPGSPEWKREYADRVGKAMDALLTGGCERVIWLLLPPMRDAPMNEHAGVVNEIVLQQAESRPGVIAHDFSPLVSDRRTGGYRERLTDPRTAASIRVRGIDGIHLSPEGARLLTRDLVKQYWH